MGVCVRFFWGGITKLSIPGLYVILAAIGMVCGCGGKASPSTVATTAPKIVVQPANESTPLGQTATFSVQASGTGTLTYQWSKDGTPVPGADGPSYTTPPVTQADSGSQFLVSIGNSAGAVTSNDAVLSVGPRSPQAFDLRFQQVDAASVAEGSIGGVFGGISNLVQTSYSGMVGSPLSLGSGICVSGVRYDCAWRYFAFDVPPSVTGLTVTYSAGILTNFDSDIASMSASISNRVITSLDIEPANNIYAASWLTTTQTDGFSLNHLITSASNIQSVAAQEAAQGHVITAISYDDSMGQLHALSYGWNGDQKTTYEVTVQTATVSSVGSVATDLAQQGYIITALGGNSIDGFFLVGARVKGDTIPRPIIVEPPYLPTTAIKGYAAVGYIADLSNTNNTIWIYEE